MYAMQYTIGGRTVRREAPTAEGLFRLRAPPSVIVVNYETHHEGEETIGVFGSIDAAWSGLRGHATSWGRDNFIDFRSPRLGEIDCGNGTYWLREMPIL